MEDKKNQKDRPVETGQNRSAKRVSDQQPPLPPSPVEPMLRKRGTGDKRLIDHHLDGLIMLYFTHEMEGSIGATRAKLSEQIGMNHIVKSINFLGDSDNKLTEVCVPRKFARWFSHNISTVREEERVIGNQYIDGKPFLPRWDDAELIPTAAQIQRRPRHVKKVLDQWYQCALRSQSETIKKFYKQVLIRVSKEECRPLWKYLVHDIIIDPSMQTYPKVVSTEKEAMHAASKRASKKRADGKHAPAVNTPISAARKRKGNKPNDEDDDMSEEESTLEADKKEDNGVSNANDPLQGNTSKNRQDPTERKTLAATQGNQAKRENRPPAGHQDNTALMSKQRKRGNNTAGDKENATPP